MKNQKKNKFSIFFIGGRERGYLCLKELIKNKEKIIGACVMAEDPHEPERYSEKIIGVLNKNSILYKSDKSLKKQEIRDFVNSKKPHFIIVMGWRTIIPKEILDLPKGGCFGVHESLLPSYRGFAPVNWSIINGEKETGVSLFYLSEGIDNGDIIAQRKIKIEHDDTALDLYKKTTKASIDILFEYLPFFKSGKAPRIKQDEKKATYTCVRLPEDGLINWNDPTIKIYNFIRGLSYPYPGAFSYLDNKKIFIWKAMLVNNKKNYIGRIPGRIVEIIKGKGIVVLTGNGELLIEEVQFEKEEKKDPSEIIKSIKITFKNKSILL